jgi:hypothetical protein
MTLSSDKTFITHATDGINKTFPYDFLIFDEDNLELWLTDADEVETEITTNYTVTDIGNPAGGDFTYPVTGDPIASGSYLTLKRAEPYTQEYDPENFQPYLADTLELSGLDILCAQIQQNRSDIERCVKVGVAGVNDPDQFLADIAQAVSDSQAAASAAEGFRDEAEAFKDEAEAAAASVTFKPEQQTASPGQTTFTMPFAITTYEEGMMIWADGVFQNRDQYTITASPDIVFTAPFIGGEKITFVSIPYQP